MRFDPETLSPRKRKVALLLARLAVFNALVMTGVLLTAAPVIAFTDAGNFPTQGARWGAAAMMILLALAAGGIGFAGKRRVERLKEVMGR